MSVIATARSKKIDPLTKRIPKNPKYQHVKATVDTGASLSKYMQRIEDMRNNYRFRKDEMFKRIKISTFVQLIIQVAEFDLNQTLIPPDEGSIWTDRPSTVDLEVQNIQNSSESSPAPSLAPTQGDFDDVTQETSRSTLESVSRGIGEMDIDRPVTHLKDENSCPYLLLDVRDIDSFTQCHIISAKSYPSAMLSRSVNSETKDLHTYRNQTGKIILLYDDDERIAPRVAQTLVERGYDNLFMLSGGLNLANKMFPNGLITGTLPESPGKQKSHPIVLASQTEFAGDDVDKLTMHVNNALVDRSIGSRLNKASTSASRQGNLSQMSSRSTMSVASSVSHRPPFKCQARVYFEIYNWNDWIDNRAKYSSGQC